MSDGKLNSFKFDINNSSFGITKIKNKELSNIREGITLLLKELEWKKYLR